MEEDNLEQIFEMLIMHQILDIVKSLYNCTVNFTNKVGLQYGFGNGKVVLQNITNTLLISNHNKNLHINNLQYTKSKYPLLQLLWLHIQL